MIHICFIYISETAHFIIMCNKSLPSPISENLRHIWDKTVNWHKDDVYIFFVVVKCLGKFENIELRGIVII